MAEKPSTYTKRWLALNKGVDQMKIGSSDDPLDCPYHREEFFVKMHDLCKRSPLPDWKIPEPKQRNSNARQRKQVKTHDLMQDRVVTQRELRKNAMRSNPHLVYSHNDPWPEDRDGRFALRAKQQFKYKNPIAPKARLSLHNNPFPNQLGSLPDVAPPGDSAPRQDGKISREMVCPEEYRRAGVNFFVN